MHLRFSSAIGIPVVEEGAEEAVSFVAGILLHPDTGKVEGFITRQRRWMPEEDLFLSSQDILHWGLVVRIRSIDVLSPLEDRIRLAALMEDGRTILDMPVVTDRGVRLGACRDVQFDTVHFQLEWLFPKTWFRWGVPVPASAIVEVRPDAVVVRDPQAREPSAPMGVLKKLDRLAEAPAPRPLDA